MLRVDRMPYAKEEHEHHGESWHDAPFKGDVPLRAREMRSAASIAPWDTDHASLTFETVMGNRPSRQWVRVAQQ